MQLNTRFIRPIPKSIARLSAATFAALSVALLATTAVQAQTITVDTSDRGWISDGGAVNYSYNHVAGEENGPVYRDWFVFNIPTLAPGQGSYTSATFRFYAYTVATSDPFETYNLNSYDGSILDLTNRTNGSATYADLGTGSFYGTTPVFSGDSGKYFDVTLNASALSAINAAAGGQFAFGGSISTLDPNSNLEYIMGFSEGSGPGDGTTQLQLTVTPEASSVVNLCGALLAPGLAGMVAVRRRKAGKAVSAA